MAIEKTAADDDGNIDRPIVVRTIGAADLKDALVKGFDDFKAMPTFALFLVIIYPIIGLVLFRVVFGHDLLPLAFPLIAGFALLGPLAAIGLYQMSRLREQGLGVSLEALKLHRHASIGAIVTLGIVLLAIFFAWLVTAQAIYHLIFGNAVPASIAEFARQVFTTSAGWTLIFVGCGVGFVFAPVVLTISVMSFPMLLDKNVDAATAVRTSVRAVLANPMTMAMWGLVVAGGLVIGSLPFLIGLAIVLPVLGHSTWHLYRKVVEC
ncbi:MAG: DUF2189 domain-containing protein [Hyphomicrobiaceae bacterium]|nr:DUF2189 domain-containing protein [Hyphomicrobiaceae bacterium]